MIVEADVYFEHHGVKGMRWGKTKEEKQAGRDEKAQKFTDKADKLQSKIDELNKKTPKTPFGRTNVRNQVFQLSQQKQQAMKDAEAKRQGKLSKGQKTAVKGAAAVAIALAAYGTYHIVQSGEGNRLVMKGKAFVQGEKLPWKTKPLLSSPDLGEDAIMSSVVKQINPEYGGIGTKMNCRRCTYSYEMRRRGFDVTATRTTNARGQDVSGILNATSPGKPRIKTGNLGLRSEVIQENLRRQKGGESPIMDLLDSGNGWGKSRIEEVHGKLFTDSIFDALDKHPDGARGELGVQWGFGGGHSLAWEKIKGKVVVFDTQSGKMFKNPDDLRSGFDAAGGIIDGGITRLDNIPLNHDFLMRWVKNA